ncbi:MAG TPA: hypothetical protein VFB77_05645 [Acidimicrobiales bacterium]|nr:hypothetical protein [Acidimicrobiales bacterium]
MEAAYYIVGILITVFIIWALVDAATKPTWAWEAAGQNKTLIIVLLVVGIFCTIVGLVTGIVWFASIRPKVLAAAQGGGAAPPAY